MALTIENWQSEYKRLELCYKHIADSQSTEALGICDHLRAVSEIISELRAAREQPAMCEHMRPTQKQPDQKLTTARIHSINLLHF
jgi:hypothetical protein